MLLTEGGGEREGEAEKRGEERWGEEDMEGGCLRLADRRGGGATRGGGEGLGAGERGLGEDRRVGQRWRGPGGGMWWRRTCDV